MWVRYTFAMHVGDLPPRALALLLSCVQPPLVALCVALLPAAMGELSVQMELYQTQIAGVRGSGRTTTGHRMLGVCAWHSGVACMRALTVPRLAAASYMASYAGAQGGARASTPARVAHVRPYCVCVSVCGREGAVALPGCLADVDLGSLRWVAHTPFPLPSSLLVPVIVLRFKSSRRTMQTCVCRL